MPVLVVRIIVTVAAIIDALLDYIVVDGNLIDSKGNDIVDSIASIMNNGTGFLAQFTVFLVNSIAD